MNTVGMDNGQRLMIVMKLLSECKANTTNAKETERLEDARSIVVELLYGDFVKWTESKDGTQ